MALYLKLATYILVTREPVPSRILKKWRPVVPFRGLSTSKKDSDIEDPSSDISEDDPSGPSLMSRPFPFLDVLPPPSQRHRNRSEDEVEEDIISISGKKLNYPSNLMI